MLLAVALTGHRVIISGEITKSEWEHACLERDQKLLSLFNKMEWQDIRCILRNMAKKYQKETSHANFNNFIAEAMALWRVLSKQPSL